MSEQAMRFNEGKPKLSYILTFDGIEAEDWIESEAAHFYAFVDTLGRWYRGEVDIDQVWSAFQNVWDEGAESFDEHIYAHMAQVCAFGEKKYARGNYLLGRNWSDTVDSLLRHVALVGMGQEHDEDSQLSHDGHITWNMCFLRHCVRTQLGADDRVRAPAKMIGVDVSAPIQIKVPEPPGWSGDWACVPAAQRLVEAGFKLWRSGEHQLVADRGNVRIVNHRNNKASSPWLVGAPQSRPGATGVEGDYRAFIFLHEAAEAALRS